MENLDEELKDIGPKLKSLRPHLAKPKLPADYFETLEGKVFDRLKAEGLAPNTQKHIPLEAKRGGNWKWLAAASLLIGIGMASIWMYKQYKPDTQTQMAQIEISAEEAENYIHEHIETFSPEELAADAQHLPNPLQSDERLRQISPNPSAPSTHSEPSQLELDLLEELSDQDLEDLL
jgi:hypothetical protein